MVCQQRVRADHWNAGGLGLRGRTDAGLNVHGNKYDRLIALGDDGVELIRLGQRIHAAIKDGKGCEAVLDCRVRLRASNPQLHEFSGHALKWDSDAMNGLTALIAASGHEAEPCSSQPGFQYLPPRQQGTVTA